MQTATLANSSESLNSQMMFNQKYFKTSGFLPLTQKYDKGKTKHADFKQEHLEILGKLLRADSDKMPFEAAVIVKQKLKPHLREKSLINGNNDATGKWITAAWNIIRQFSKTPWSDIDTDLQKEKGRFSPDELNRICLALQKSSFFQTLITEQGLGRAYWKTIRPMYESGTIDAVIKNKTTFPFRLRLHPGKFCPFQCRHCDYRHGTAYTKAETDSGDQILKNLISKIPTNSFNEVSLAGGFETLCSKHIGEYAELLSERGFKTELFTNGFFLTPHLLGKQKGIWNLDKLRISLYGTDEDSYFYTTGKRGAFNRVIKNVRHAISLRNQINPKLKIGFSHIVFNRQVVQLSKVFDFIADINQTIQGPGLDFISIRQDYNGLKRDDLTLQDKTQLSDILKQADEKVRSGSFGNDLHIDLGFAITAMRDGDFNATIPRVSADEFRAKCFPQVTCAVDAAGNVIGYSGASFLSPDSQRFKIGKIKNDTSLQDVISEYLKLEPPEIVASDEQYLNAFELVCTKIINRAEKDRNNGPVKLTNH